MYTRISFKSTDDKRVFDRWVREHWPHVYSRRVPIDAQFFLRPGDIVAWARSSKGQALVDQIIQEGSKALGIDVRLESGRKK